LDKNLLVESGTSQSQRSLAALSASYAQVDERTARDLILFAQKYGAYLNYYDLTNAVSGDWQELMSKDVTVAIANVSSWRTKDYSPFIKDISDLIQSSSTADDAKKYFKVIFDLVFTLASGLDTVLRLLPDDVDYQEYLSTAISSGLAIPLNVLTQYYQTFKTASLIDDTSVYTDPNFPADNLVFSQNFNLALLSPQWQTVVTAPTITLTGVVLDDINLIITHNLFTGILQSFTDAVINIVSQSPGYLEETLENYPSHEPHYALFLTFLRLFRFAQDHLNEYTQDHLDFYYKNVLQLANNAAVPDFVHLIFELQKNTDQHLLSKGTNFKAGKDANNNDLYYALTDNLMVNKAVVQSLKSLYLDKDEVPVTLYGSPVADSEDGQGGKLSSADGSWMPFGNPQKASPAALGFAIASNILFLNEGQRIVALIFNCDSLAGVSDSDFQNIFTIWFTGQKKWFAANTYKAQILGNSFVLLITLAGDAQPVIPYSQKIHGGNFTEGLPMVQVMLNSYTSYQKIKALKIKSILLEVNASVKNLSLQNDDGKIDPSKPFKPFGEFPEYGASFIIGSKEIFQKKLAALKVIVEWQNAPVSGTTASVNALLKSNWEPLPNSLDISGLSFSLTNPASLTPMEEDFSANEDYAITSTDGFIKLELESTNYSIDTYLNGVSSALSNASVNIITTNGNVTGYQLNAPAVQKPPTPPVAKSISIDYTALESITFNEPTVAVFAVRSNFYYHIEPFGFREMSPYLTSDPLTLLPVFDLDDGVPKDDGGELWIGLSNAVPGETYSFLFQVSDGTANPLKNMTGLDWYYLSKNNWRKFGPLSVNDLTNNLTRSGLVVLNVPPDATLLNTRADTGLLWLKGVVSHDPDAVCNLIAVVNNAAKAEFFQNIPAGIELTQTLPPNTISKPAVADASLKKTDQPYASFDGRLQETDDQFYIRVSERLRHKHRAWAAWDYERLVLQQFPQIHKVKCLNHTGFININNTLQQKYSEVLPGHVTIVTIPDLSHTNSLNPLLPYTSIGLLAEIKHYLSSLDTSFLADDSSGNEHLHLVNPQFEGVQFDFKVSFLPGYDEIFYSNLLKNEIIQFLTPWAYDTTQEVEFGGKIEKSVVLNFVQERPYVDFVTCFKMNQYIPRNNGSPGGGNDLKLSDIEEAVASTARSILVSYFNEITKESHLISTPAKCDCNG
jgi:hypothetical protein